MFPVACTNCHAPYPELGVPYRCPACTGIFDYTQIWLYRPPENRRDLPGIWRFHESMGLTSHTPIVSLSEGNTALVWSEAFGHQVAFKCEYLNPSGSFKDRGSALLVSFLQARGVSDAMEDSSGNAGASFAAYAARGGLTAHVLMPEKVSGSKRRQIELYGAEVVAIPGPRSNAAKVAQEEAERGAVYASHAYLPFNLPGYATIAYELVEQMERSPGTVIMPVGQGGLLLGIGRGFEALYNAGIIERIPTLVGVQARACAPFWALTTHGPAGLAWVAEGDTLAEGIRIHHPVRGDVILRWMESHQGSFVAVDEEEILPGRDQLAQRGLYVEPTSAVTWAALAQVVDRIPEPIAVVLTGSGLKYADWER